ncbi:MAG TPA: hypothetical protein VD862_04140 [Candidatus Paceibacterota bacterium]|nr:hypothetical protein [Candidatus Paceibacterota bacterium]
MMSIMPHKRLILIAASALSAGLTWWTGHRWLSAFGDFGDWRLYLPPLLLVIVFAAVAGLSLALLRNRWDRLAIIAFSWGIFVAFFPASIWNLSALPVFLLLLMHASRRSIQERDERQKFNARAVVGAGTRFIVLGMFLMVSLGFYSLRAEDGITLDAVSASVQKQVDAAYETDFVREQLTDVPPSLQSQVRRDVARSVDSFIRRWLSPLAPFLPPILALVLFLGLWSVVGLIREPALWLAAGLFWVFRRTGFIVIESREVTREVVEL